MAEKNKGFSASVPNDRELRLLEAKRSVIFQRIQQIYDSSKDVQTADIHVRESFLSSVVTLDTLRTEFQNLLDQYNDRLLTVDPDATPQYYSLISFDELYGRIKLIKSQISPQTQNKEASLRKTKPTLPPIELRSFDGDILSWPLFYANFKSTIHDNTTLTDSERMYYLLGKLTGKALTACSGITPCGENYSLLLQTLIDKYDDKRMLAATYLDQLLEFQSISASADNFDLFIEKFVAAFRGLKNLKLADLADFIILHIALKKLDSDSVHTFERLGDSSTIPTFDDLINFIKHQSKIMQRSSHTSPSGSTTKIIDRGRTENKKNTSSRKLAFVTTINNKPAVNCLCDNITHRHLFQCPRFMQASPEERFKLVKKYNACVNCLSNTHSQVSVCTSNRNCKKCNLRHSTWLHFNATDSNPATPSRMPDSVTTAPLGTAPAVTRPMLRDAHTPSVDQPSLHAPAITKTCSTATATQSENIVLCATSIAAPRTLCDKGSTQPREQCTIQTSVLLATAQVIVYDSTGNTHVLRCLLDTAAEANFISSDCCKRLNMGQDDTPHMFVKGFGGSEKPISKSVSLRLNSKYNTNIKFDISALVVDRITDDLPSSLIDKNALSHLNNLHLADNSFASPNPIDILIGASLFPHLLLPGVVLGKPSEPSAIHTVFGYVLMGSAPTLKPAYAQATTTACLALVRIPSTITKNNSSDLQELTCMSVQGSVGPARERSSITARVPAGDSRTVALPFHKKYIFTIGSSHKVAYKHPLCLPRKFKAPSQLRLAFNEAYRDYLRNNYISFAPRDVHDRSSIPISLFPHHDVIREDKSNATQLRVALDVAGALSTSDKNRSASLHEPQRALLASSQLPNVDLDGTSVPEMPGQNFLTCNVLHMREKHSRAYSELIPSAIRPSFRIITDQRLILTRVYHCHARVKLKPRSSSLTADLPEIHISHKFKPRASQRCGDGWESIVKILTFQLFKAIGQQPLSFEVLTAVLGQRACLLMSELISTMLGSITTEPIASVCKHRLQLRCLRLNRHSRCFKNRWRGVVLGIHRSNNSLTRVTTVTLARKAFLRLAVPA